MMNFPLSGLAELIHILSVWEVIGKTTGRHDVEPGIRRQAAGWLKMATSIADAAEDKAARDRINIFQKLLKKRDVEWRELGVECRVLRETIQAGFKHQYIYRYPNEQAAIAVRWTKEWEDVIDKFPSAAPDIFAAVDCWALGHGTPAVFMLMRVVEFGIGALAQDLGLDVGTDNWQNIIDRIEAKVREVGKTLPRGREKNARLQVLSEAAKEIVYFKDGWRNYVTHHHAHYDTHQARSVLEHVRAFMIVISKRLSEVDPSIEPR
jgi:hypothetical protein